MFKKFEDYVNYLLGIATEVLYVVVLFLISLSIFLIIRYIF